MRRTVGVPSVERRLATLGLFFALLARGVESQTPSTGPTQGTCNATLAIRNCALDPSVAPPGREFWPAGLLEDVSRPIFGQDEDYTLFADHVAFLIHQLFRDADRKESHLYDRPGSPGECYFPLLYYTCASAYHECREDANVTVRVEREIFPPPAAPGTPAGSQTVLTESVLEPLKVPRYPCQSFCEDAGVRRCKDALIVAVNESLAGLPTLRHYVDNITDWFNCTKLRETSRYSRENKADVCLARPVAPSPPPTPPPPGAPPTPPMPPTLSRAARASGAEVATRAPRDGVGGGGVDVEEVGASEGRGERSEGCGLRRRAKW